MAHWGSSALVLRFFEFVCQGQWGSSCQVLFAVFLYRLWASLGCQLSGYTGLHLVLCYFSIGFGPPVTWYWGSSCWVLYVLSCVVMFAIVWDSSCWVLSVFQMFCLFSFAQAKGLPAILLHKYHVYTYRCWTTCSHISVLKNACTVLGFEKWVHFSMCLSIFKNQPKSIPCKILSIPNCQIC